MSIWYEYFRHRYTELYDCYHHNTALGNLQEDYSFIAKIQYWKYYNAHHMKSDKKSKVQEHDIK